MLSETVVNETGPINSDYRYHDIESQIQSPTTSTEIRPIAETLNSLSETVENNFHQAFNSKNRFDPYQCFICLDHVDPVTCPDANPFRLSCGHTFCKGCLQDYVSNCINDGNSFPKCFYPISTNEPKVDDSQLQRLIEKKCGVAIIDADLDSLLVDSAMRVKYERFKFMKLNPNGRECPFDGCGALQIGDPTAPRMHCHKCQKDYCLFHANAHPDTSCEDYSKQTANEVEVNETYINQTSKPCPSCGRMISKSGGCNHIKCVCGAAFCWLCGKQVEDSVFPRHFQWWNANGCSNMQMASEIEPSFGTRLVARTVTCCQLLTLGPLSLASTVASGLCCFPCMVTYVVTPDDNQTTASHRLSDLTTQSLTIWGYIYLVVLFIMPMLACGASLVAAVLIVFYPVYAGYRLYNKRYPWPDWVTTCGRGVYSGLFLRCFRGRRRQLPEPSEDIELGEGVFRGRSTRPRPPGDAFHRHRMEVDIEEGRSMQSFSHNYSNSTSDPGRPSFELLTTNINGIEPEPAPADAEIRMHRLEAAGPPQEAISSEETIHLADVRLHVTPVLISPAEEARETEKAPPLLREQTAIQNDHRLIEPSSIATEGVSDANMSQEECAEADKAAAKRLADDETTEPINYAPLSQREE